MKKTKIEININDFPSEIHYIIKDASIYDSTCGPNSTVLYSDRGYYIKITEKGKLKEEAKITELLYQKGLTVEMVMYISKDKDYMVTRAASGEDGGHYLDNPERLCEVLAETMKYLHSQPITDLPVSPCMEQYAQLDREQKIKKDTFIHGDFCLPNVMIDNWKFSSFLDVGLAGVGDKHIDIYWVIWSLEYNLKTDEYKELFLDLYGRENIDFDALKLVAEVEASL